MKIFRRSMLLLFIAIMLFSAVSVVTYPNEYRVIKTMGKISRVTEEPGLTWRIPIIQSETEISMAKRLYDIAPTEIYTSDKKKMEVDAYIIWKVTDPVKFTQTLNAVTSNAESKITAMVYGALKAVVSAMTQEELIASRDTTIDIVDQSEIDDIVIQDISAEEDTDAEQEKVKVVSLSEKVLEQLDRDYDQEQYGIEIQMVKVKKLDLPDENKDAVYNRMITERKNIAAAYKAQGESEAQKIRNMTDRETEVMLSEANAKAAGLEAEGEAEYMKILSDAYNDPDKADFYLFVRQLDATKKSMKNGNTTLFLDSDSPLAEIFTTDVE